MLRGGIQGQEGRGTTSCWPPGYIAALIAATVEQRQSVLAVQTLFHHHSCSLIKPGGSL
jgi:hypothetical protein